MKKLIVANWKMNIPDLKLWRSFRAPRNVDVVICPPSPYLDGVSKLLRAQSLGLRASLGAQDIFWEEGGAFTGEVSGKMLKGFGVTHVIIGHSERRKWLNETDEMINKKVLAALKVRLKAILCVGEPLIVRKKGIAAAKSFVKSQLTKDLAGISNLKSQI
ncbi:MAG: triose-phosphate isomerase [Candidatus Liptonbacteria bacterium]|nr:triose-phosphate isomerase [Candidatus Liptonbacteria bacterium]